MCLIVHSLCFLIDKVFSIQCVWSLSEERANSMLVYKTYVLKVLSSSSTDSIWSFIVNAFIPSIIIFRWFSGFAILFKY